MPVLRLTTQFVANELHCPDTDGKSRIEYCDSELPGLYIEVRATRQGQGTYYVRYRNANGKTCRQRIGRTTEIDLDEARKRARQLRAGIASGSDPRADAKALKVVPTYASYITDVYIPYVKGMMGLPLAGNAYAGPENAKGQSGN